MQTNNYSKVAATIKNTWRLNLEIRRKSGFVCLVHLIIGCYYDNTDCSIPELERWTNISTHFIQTIFRHFWRSEGTKLYEKQLQGLRKISSRCLRIDFTYQFVNNLHGYDEDNNKSVYLYHVQFINR